MSWFKFNDISSDDLNLIVTKLGTPQQTAITYETIKIPNRLVPILQRASSLDLLSISIDVFNCSDNLYNIYSCLSGYGTLITSLDDTKYYKCWVSQLQPNKIFNFYNEISINFNALPFAYVIEDTPTVLSSGGSINVKGSIYSEPIIKIYGSGNGTITVNGVTTSVYVDGYLTLDSERLLAYKDNTVYLNQMAGEFPRFQVGNNSISFSGGISSIEIFKNERWL